MFNYTFRSSKTYNSQQQNQIRSKSTTLGLTRPSAGVPLTIQQTTRGRPRLGIPGHTNKRRKQTDSSIAGAVKPRD